MAEILFIAPLPELAELAKEVSQLGGKPEIDIKVARMEEAVKIAQEAEEQGYHVVVSRSNRLDAEESGHFFAGS